jgi:predicted transcriptional regulator
MGVGSLFGSETRSRLAHSLGTEELSVSSVQSTLRHLERRGLIGRTQEKTGEYFIDDPNFKNWLGHKEEVGELV